jgi:hypothetical protein
MALALARVQAIVSKLGTFLQFERQENKAQSQTIGTIDSEETTQETLRPISTLSDTNEDKRPLPSLEGGSKEFLAFQHLKSSQFFSDCGRIPISLRQPNHDKNGNLL